MKKGKKIFWIVLITVIIIILVVLLILFLKKDKNSKINENKLQNVMADRISELLDINYQLSYLFKGNVKTDEGYIDNLGVKYYGVNDENITVSNLDEISDMIKNYFLESFSFDYLINNDSYNKYIESDNKLFVAKRNECQKFPKLDKNFISSYTQGFDNEINDSMIYVYNNNSEYNYDFYVFKENDKWVLNSLDFQCQD